MYSDKLVFLELGVNFCLFLLRLRIKIIGLVIGRFFFFEIGEMIFCFNSLFNWCFNIFFLLGVRRKGRCNLGIKLFFKWILCLIKVVFLSWGDNFVIKILWFLNKYFFKDFSLFELRLLLLNWNLLKNFLELLILYILFIFCMFVWL